MMARYGRIYDDGGMEDIIAPSSRVTFQDQSRKGLKRAAFKAVFDGNPFNPQDEDTFLEDYMADNNIAEFRNKRKKRIFDRAVRRNLEDRESYMRDGYGILPTAYDGYSQMVTPDGVSYIRSETPMQRDDVLGWMPLVGDAYEAQDIADSIDNGDYVSAGMLTGLAVVPGTVATKYLKGPVKRLASKVGKRAEKGIMNGSGFWSALYPAKARDISDKAYRRMRLAGQLNDPDNVHTGRYMAPVGGSRHLVDYNIYAPEFSAELSRTTDIGDKVRHIDYGNGLGADVGSVVNTQTVRSITGDMPTGLYTVYNESRKVSGNIASDNVTYRIDNNTVSPAVSAENQRLNTIMNGDGVITGSASVYGEIPGMPNDVDIITTPSRKDRVVRSLNLRDSGNSNAIGDSKYISDSPIHGKNSVDLDVIHESDGHAEGTLAENIFSYVDPEGYYNWRNGNLERHYGKNALEPIPYSADQLYDMLMSDPDGVIGFNKLNAVKSGRIKDNDRLTAMISVDPKSVTSSVIRNGKSLFGKSFRSAESLYPNMRYDDIEANRKFLKELGLSESWAGDPDKMRAVVEKFSFEKTTATRGISSASSIEHFRNAAVSPSASSNVSGAGRNSVEGSPDGGGGGFTAGGVTALQFPVSYKEESFNNPMDLLNVVRRQTNSDSAINKLFSDSEIADYNRITSSYHVDPEETVDDLFDSINSGQSNFRDFNSMADMNDRISRVLDLPVIRDKRYYFENDGSRVKKAGYVGGLSKDYYGLGYDLPNKKLELGSLFPMNYNSKGTRRATDPTREDIQKVNRVYKNLGRYYAGDRSALKGIRFISPVVDKKDVLSYRRNQRITNAYNERSKEISDYRQQLLDKQVEKYHKVLDSRIKGESIREVASVTGGLGLGTAAVAGVVRALRDKNVNRNIDERLDSLDSSTYNPDEIVDNVSDSVLYDLGVDPEDTDSVEYVRKYIHDKVDKRGRKK